MESHDTQVVSVPDQQITPVEVDWLFSTILCERHLIDFIQEAWPLIESADYIDNGHFSTICEHIEAVMRWWASWRWRGIRGR